MMWNQALGYVGHSYFGSGALIASGHVGFPECTSNSLQILQNCHAARNTILEKHVGWCLHTCLSVPEGAGQ